MRNHEVITSQLLLKDDGSLREPGWSRTQVQIYDKRMIKAPKYRIKEWDYYLVLNKDFACAFTLSDDGYIGLQSVSLLNFKEGWEHTETILNLFPMGKYHFPSQSSKGDIIYKDNRLTLKYILTKGKREIICGFKDFYNKKPFSCHIILDQKEEDSMVIATPWKEDPKAFYYNQKINCMSASGYALYDGVRYTFNPETDFGTLDWGRGVWTYDNRWYWSSGNMMLEGKRFGFNLGYGFGDTSAATENILFYDGKAHKLDDVTFNIPEDDYLRPWTFTSSDHRFEATFEPVLDRAAKIDA